MFNFRGQSIGRYQVLDQLGVGGMAVVYKAFDTHLECNVAIKFLRTDQLAPTIIEKALKRFEREAKKVAKLDHPNTVKVTDYGEYESKPYLVMPYLPGGTLKQFLREHGRMSWREAVELLIPVAKALEYAHEMKLIHRDVKPSNILLTGKGIPMLTDFGVAKALDDEATQDLKGTTAMVGTPDYMAPEQVISKTVDHRADIYALGVVFFEMITGRRPYEADTPMAVLVKHATDPLPRPLDLVPDLPEKVEQVLIKALAKKPEDRYQDMGNFINSLEKLALLPESEKARREAAKQTSSKGSTPQTPKQRRFLESGLWVGMGIAVGLVILIVVFYLINPHFFTACSVVTDSTGTPTNSMIPSQKPIITLTPFSTPTINFTQIKTPLLSETSTKKCDLGVKLTEVGEYSLIIPITEDNQDGYEDTSFHISGDGNKNDWVGTDTSVVTGLVFVNVQIPEDAEIINSYIKFRGFGNRGESITRITGFGEDNPVLFTTNGTNKPSARPPTSSCIDWENSWWSSWQWFKTPQLNTIINEIISQPNWIPGNNIGFGFSNANGTGINWAIVDFAGQPYLGGGGAGHSTTLYITYNLPQDHISPTNTPKRSTATLGQPTNTPKPQVDNSRTPNWTWTPVPSILFTKTFTPTNIPTNIPIDTPINIPINTPTNIPIRTPTFTPSPNHPTEAPTDGPTHTP